MLAEIIGIVVNIAKQILVCTEIIGYRYQSGTLAKLYRLEGAKIASGADSPLNKITSKSAEMFLAIKIRACVISLNQQTQDGKTTFAATLNRERNSHEKNRMHFLQAN